METDTIFLWDDKKTIMIDHTQLVVIYLQFGPVYSRSFDSRANDSFETRQESDIAVLMQ